MTVAFLEPIPPVAPRPDRSPEDYLPMQRLTREIAFEPGCWDPQRKERIAKLFDDLAPEWHSRGGEERLAPTRDALERGSVPHGGTAIEIGSGTGIQTVPLLERFDFVVSLDLAPGMLARAPRRANSVLVQGDAAALPLADRCADAVVCVNAYLFAREYARVLRPTGRIVFVSTSGDNTPIYLAPDDLVAALEPTIGPLHATSSRHGWGTWTIVTRLS
ncbi:MAG: class I SAM-dependent methyltransferase [Acidimicrobiales bacterium]